MNIINLHCIKEKKYLLYIIIVLTTILLTSEFIARYYFGLGDPPLSIKDPQIDYLFAPNQSCMRFGNKIHYNNYSMRTDFDVHQDFRNCKRRVLVCGDSIINGGSLTDQDNIATSIVQSHYQLNDIQILNISAGSWGPGNFYAYLSKYGCFDSTDIIIQVSSHDLWEDDPEISKGKIVGKDLHFPARKPICALSEGIIRYLIPKIKRIFINDTKSKKIDIEKSNNNSDINKENYNLNIMSELYKLKIPHKALMIYRTKKESRNNEITYGEAIFRKQAEEHNIKVYLLELNAELDYRDSIHPNENGQYKMSELIEQILNDINDK